MTLKERLPYAEVRRKDNSNKAAASAKALMAVRSNMWLDRHCGEQLLLSPAEHQNLQLKKEIRKRRWRNMRAPHPPIAHLST